jgi:Cdc25 family phosphatase
MPELVRNLKDQETVVFHCALSQQRGPSSALRYLRERERLANIKNQESKSEDVTGDSTEDKVANKKTQTVYVLDGGFTKWQEVSVKYRIGNYPETKLTLIYLGTATIKS